MTGGLRTRTIDKQPSEQYPLVTVVTIVFNGASLLENTIDSVLRQTYSFLEYIIIDGGSTDATLDVILKYENYIDFWISKPDRGIADAMNKGILLAKGSLINFLHAGDRFAAAQSVSTVVNSYLDECWRWCYGHQRIVDEQGIVARNAYSPEFERKVILFLNFIPHQTVFAEKSLFEEAGLFDTQFKCAMDYHLWLRFIEISQPALIDDFLVDFLSGGLSSNITYALLEEYKARELILKRYFFITIIDWITVRLRLIKNKLGITGSVVLTQKLLKLFHQSLLMITKTKFFATSRLER
jgi:glycosyltransferase involved in cell wall biosynthesis